jgi:hypothetical protein
VSQLTQSLDFEEIEWVDELEGEKPAYFRGNLLTDIQTLEKLVLSA